jgi:hypothetical protein
MVDPLLDEIIEADGERYRVAWFDPLSWGAETTAGLILERGLAMEEIVASESAR